MLGGADNPNGELLSYIIGADTKKARWKNSPYILALKDGVLRRTG